jgi:hypothetical protein
MRAAMDAINKKNGMNKKPMDIGVGKPGSGADLNHKMLLTVTIAVFCVSVLIRIYFSVFDKAIVVYSDELRYLDIARSLWTNGSIVIRNIPVDFQKILYPLFIAPTSMITDPSGQIAAINILNSIYISSAVFPAYLIAKQILKKNWAIILSVVFVATLPDMTYSICLMSENVYFPLAIWAVFLIWKAISSEKIKYGIFFAVAGGLLSYLLYLSKEISLAFVLAYAVIVAADIIKSKKIRKQKLFPFLFYCASFGLLFIVFKMTLFAGMGNSYNQMGLDALSAPQAWWYLLYSFVYTSLGALIGFYYFPVVLPYVRSNDLSEKDKILYRFVIITILIAIFVISYTISIREDLGSLAPRLHLRYLAPFVVPLFILFIKLVSESGENILTLKKHLKKAVVAGTVTIAAVFVIMNANAGIHVDQTPLAYVSDPALSSLIGNITERVGLDYLVFVKIIVSFLIIAGTVFLFKLHAKKALLFFVIVIMGLNICNNVLCIKRFTNTYEISAQQVTQAEEINRKIKAAEGNVLVVLGSYDARLIDTYLTSSAYYISAGQLLSCMDEQGFSDIDEDMFSESMSLTLTVGHSLQSVPDSVDYILTDTDTVGFNNAELIAAAPDAGLMLYKNLDSQTVSAYKVLDDANDQP